MQIHSPIATGNGAYIVHRTLERHIPGYSVCGYRPAWTFFPPALPVVCRNRDRTPVHTTPDYAIFADRKGAPLVVTFHNYVLDRFMRNYSSVLQRLHYTTDLKWFTRLAVNRAHRLTAVSRYTAELVRRELRCDREIQVIYNGIDETRFRPYRDRQDTNRKITVLFSGNPSRRKGAHLLPEIANLLNPGIEIVYTSGLHRNKRIAVHPSLRAIGQIPHDEMPTMYNEADILLFPTVREGMSLAVLEAMACGLPVVATDCSSLPEQIDKGRGGFLCELGNAAQFAAFINELADSPQKRLEMGEHNRARVERDFTLSAMLDSYMKLFSML
jgi:glycosyltransferase involved in cell wall biosynthesis